MSFLKLIPTYLAQKRGKKEKEKKKKKKKREKRKKVESKTEIKCIPFNEVPVKSLDASMGLLRFRFIKTRLGENGIHEH